MASAPQPPKSKMSRKMFLLQESTNGERVRLKWFRKNKNVILRGELLLEGDGAVRYQLHDDPSVQIQKDCSVSEIWEDDYQLLRGIQSPEARYHVYNTSQTVTWGASLKNGDKARLSIYLPDSVDKWATTEVLVHYIGPFRDHLGTIFGVEISEQKYRGKGNSDGTAEDTQYFHCERNCGLFVSLDRLAPLPGFESDVDAVSKPLEQSFHEGSMVQVFLSSDKVDYGVVRWIGDVEGIPEMQAGLEMDDGVKEGTDGMYPGNNQRLFSCEAGRALFCPLSSLQADQRFTDDNSAAPAKAVDEPLHEGSMVQLLVDGSNPEYGVVRWVGKIESIPEVQAGIEMEENIKGGTDGTYPRKKEKLFSCEPGRALFRPLSSLQPDMRFVEKSGPDSAELVNPLDTVAHEEEEDQVIKDNQFQMYIGEHRGIQGHQNSCYLDAAVFGLFALSHEFDQTLLGDVSDPTRREISIQLRRGIVNTLRKNGVVRFESVMKLRDKLEDLGKMTGINQDEKDPEEFLNMLFKFALQTEPFIRIRRSFGVEQEYFVQLFLENDDSLQLPSVGHLLNKMFSEQSISFTEIPSKLLVILPRYGRQFRAYKKIIPELKLNVSNLCDHECNVCGKMAHKYCVDCMAGFENGLRASLFCVSCWELVHGHPQRTGHQYQSVSEVDEQKKLGELDLLSVICIETSHHICFTRSQHNKWLFFDSMADRLGNSFNIPKVVDCTHLLNDWVYGGDEQRLMDTPPRELPELVRRFTQDLYLCVYTRPPHTTKPEENEQVLALTRKNEDLKKALEREKKKDEGAHRLEVTEKKFEQENRELKEKMALMQQQRDHEIQHQKAHMQKLAPRVCSVEDWQIQRDHLEISENDCIENGFWGEVLCSKLKSHKAAVHVMVKVTNKTTELQHEIEKVICLQHPCLVHFIGAVIDKIDLPCVVTEVIDMDLRRAYKEKRIASFGHSIFLDVAYGLHYLHTQPEPIVHGELSAAHVLLLPVGDSWRAKISAFRFSKFMKMPTHMPCFLAPEVYVSDDTSSLQLPAVSMETDVYSYGVLLYEVTTKDNTPVHSKAHAEKTVDKMKKASPAMYGIFDECTAHDPKIRPSMAQVVTKLHTFDKIVTHL